MFSNNWNNSGILLILIACIWSRVVDALPRDVRIGAIFSSRNSTAEWAFKYAIHRINSDKSMLPNTNLLFNIQYVDEFNSFDACKKACDQIGHGVQVIFGPANENLGSHIHSICDALDIPYIDIHIDKYQENRDVAINIYPTQHHVNRAFMDVIQYLNWTKLGILYEKDFGILELRDMMRSTTLEIHVRQVDPGTYIDVLQELKNNEVYNIIIDTDSTKMSIILKGILQLQMNEYKYHFLFTSFDIETFDLEDFKYNMVNITSFRLVDFTDVGVKRTIKDIETFINRNRPGLDFESQMMTTEAALIYDAVYVFTIGLQNLEQSHSLQSSNVSCSVEIPYDAGLSLINYINSVEWKGLTGATQFKEGHRVQFKLDLVKLKQHSIVKVGEWSPPSGLNITNPLLFFDAGSMNLTLVVITILETPYVMMHLGKNFTGNSRFFGFCVDILETIAHEVGFDYILDLVPDRKYGAKDPVTGEWNGMVAQLMKYKADLAVGSMTITYARESVIDFTKPFMNLGISILFKVPSTPSTRLFSFMNPLGFEVWIYVIAAYFLVSITLYYTAKFLPLEWRDAHPCDVNNVVKTNQLTIANSFWFAIITLMQQGSDVYPKSISTRIISSIWWFFTLIIVASYTANLAAFLTVERMTTPIENAEDLASQTEISYGTLESGSTMTFFRDSMIETYKKMWRNMENKKKTSFTSTYEEGINRVNQGSYAFLMESTMLDYIVQRNCNYTQIGGLLDTKGYGIATPKGSPWRDKISLAILELQEKGDIQMLYDKWWKSNSETCVRNHNNKQSKANALGLDNIGGVFVVLLVGVGFAICVSIFEFCQYYKQEGMSHQPFSESPEESSVPGDDSKPSGEKESTGQPIQHAAVPRQSMCMAMFEEFKNALSCTDSRRRPVLKRYCSKCCVVYQKNPPPQADQ